ncbi:hypothetical protein ABKN59_011040 [Abortiporus biennis]
MITVAFRVVAGQRFSLYQHFLLLRQLTTTMRSPASTIVLTYPDQNPFNPNPSYPNIFPTRPAECDNLSAADIKNPYYDPLAGLHGHNPFQYTDENPMPPRIYIDNHQTSPPPLPEIFLSSLEFIERLNHGGRAHVYKVSATITSTTTGEPREKIYALKMFRDMDPDEESDQKEIGWPMFRFRREKEAYAHLIHAGLPEQGIVPNCYGWLTLSNRSYLEQCYALPVSEKDDLEEFWSREKNKQRITKYGPDTASRSHTLLDDRRPPKALLLEYYADLEPLSGNNVTHDIAEAALKALYQIHAAYVHHGDLSHDTNVFVRPGNRVMWIDFDESTCRCERNWRKKLSRQKLMEELEHVWSRFYQIMLADQPLVSK